MLTVGRQVYSTNTGTAGSCYLLQQRNAPVSNNKGWVRIVHRPGRARGVCGEGDATYFILIKYPIIVSLVARFSESQGEMAGVLFVIKGCGPYASSSC